MEQAEDNQPKRSPFESMSQDELVKKCKGLLMLLQKSKQVKDELVTENRSLKESVAQFEEQKAADKHSLKIMQDNLSEQALQSATKVTELEQQLKLKGEEINNQNDMSVENESLKRQLKRITDENDEFMQEINTMEAKFQEAEKAHAVKLEEAAQKLATVEENYKRACKSIEKLQESKTIYKDKSNAYKGKILEIANKFQKLKSSHIQTLKVVREYSQSIPNWQRELKTVLGVINENNDEKRQLLHKIKELESKIQTSQQSLDESDGAPQSNLSRKVLSQIESEKVAILDEKSKLEISLKDMDNKLKSIKQENSDLLQEMKDLNEILKERGEVISKQQSELSVFETENGTLKTNLNKIESILLEKNKTIQNLVDENKVRGSNDDAMSTSTISKLGDGQDSKQNEEDFEEKYQKVKEVAMKLKKRLDEETKKSKALQEESDKLTDLVKNHQTEISKKEEDIRKAKEKEIQLSNELEKTKKMAKKSNVLALEMDAYEKSMEEAVKKLKQKEVIITDLETTIQEQTSTIESIKNQSKMIEDRIESEVKHNQELIGNISKFQQRIKELESEKFELINNVEKISKERNELQKKIEENKLETITKQQETETFAGSLQVERDRLYQTNIELDSQIKSYISKIEEKDNEIQTIEKEFYNYKTRVHSVLKEQSKVNSHEAELEEKINNLNLIIGTMEQKSKSSEASSQEMERSNIELQERVEKLTMKNTDLSQINQQLKQENINQTEMHQESLKTQKINMETLKNIYKKQIEELELKIQQLIVEQLERANDKAKTSSTDEEKMKEMHLHSVRRGDGEGSESGTSSQHVPKRKLSRKISRNSNPGFIPLEDLLNSNYDDFDSQSQLDISTEEDRKILTEQYRAKEMQIKHLQTLLAEAEQDVAKLNQLNDVLKEEVRKQERTVERNAHMHNSEYIKNVIFKFLTLNNGDEKVHLVPVLNTILKLSPDETQKLQNVAKGAGSESSRWSLFK